MFQYCQKKKAPVNNGHTCTVYTSIVLQIHSPQANRQRNNYKYIFGFIGILPNVQVNYLLGADQNHNDLILQTNK